MEPFPPDPGDNDLKRQNMISALTHGIESEDYEFVNEVITSQDLLRPFEIVEFMDVKRRASEDPVEGRRWEDGLGHYLTAIEGQEFPAEEAEAINSVIEKLEFERVVGNEETADEPRIQRSEMDEDADKNWGDDYFKPTDIDADELERLAGTPIGQSVVKDARDAINNGNPAYLSKALETISAFQLGSSEKLRKLLDVYVCKLANKQARAAIENSNSAYLDKAIDSIHEFGSSEDAVQAMRGSLDKHVFEYAKKQIARAVANSNSAYIGKAIEALYRCVSSEGRIKAMLDELLLG